MDYFNVSQSAELILDLNINYDGELYVNISQATNDEDIRWKRIHMRYLFDMFKELPVPKNGVRALKVLLKQCEEHAEKIEEERKKLFKKGKIVWEE